VCFALFLSLLIESSILDGKSFKIESLLEESGEEDLLVDDLDSGLGQLVGVGPVFRTRDDELVRLGFSRKSLQPSSTSAFNHVCKVNAEF